MEQVCAHVHNYFPGRGRIGDFVIADGEIELPEFDEGTWFRIIGSARNDGVHRYPTHDLTDEAFSGAVWEVRAPRAFLDLVNDIEAWQARYGGTADSPCKSENVIGVYAYAKDDGGWQRAFRSRLDNWRRLA